MIPSAYAEEEPIDPQQRIAALEARLEELEERLKATEAPSTGPTFRISGFADFGFFVPIGNGAGVVRDTDGAAPDLSNRFGWVFLGDLLSTTVNSRGEPASLGDLPGVERFDSIDSKGAASFLLNEVNVTAGVGLSSSLFFTGSVNFVPRSGTEFSIGDFVEVDLAQLEWIVTSDGKLELFAGKVAPVLGNDYRRRKAVDRFGVTPSLIARYTSGTPLGLKARAKLFDDWLVLTAAITNGSPGIEQFHFSREVDTNDSKTLAGRAAVRIPTSRWLGEGMGTLEIGGSGEYGAQDFALDGNGAMWLAGGDIAYTGTVMNIRAEFLVGRSPGRAIDGAYSLNLNGGGFLEIDYLVIEQLGFLARVEMRDALVTLGSERAYLSKTWRVVGGARAVISSNLAIKAEYLKNGEYGELPNIKNDIFTSSVILSF